jgi:pimeloyl-ACP methyl ester carboxylesterase
LASGLLVTAHFVGVIGTATANDNERPFKPGAACTDDKSPTSAPFEVERHTNIPYRTDTEADPVRHKLDVYCPKGQKDFPVVLFVHGGGWDSGTKLLYFAYGEVFARAGIGFVVCNYRLSPKVRHPAHVQDVAKAFAWTRENIGKYGGDAERVFVCGHSAGGHLVSLLATDPQYLKAEKHSTAEIRGVVSISGVYRIVATERVFHEPFGTDEANCKNASPLTHVVGKHPPLGIVLLAGGALIVFIGLACRISGVPMGLPKCLAGGLVALALGGTGTYVILAGVDGPGWGRDPLAQMHRDTVKHFTEQDGFGANRMPVRPAMSEDSQAVYQVFRSELDREASRLHADEKGFPKTWESDGPKPGEKTRWTVRTVQLVGLTKNPQPVVYLTDRLPKMDQVTEIPTRPLDEFETEALRLVRRGQELHSRADGKQNRMMAPIYADASCVWCHEPQGKLLGAFTYEIERETVPHN